MNRALVLPLALAACLAPPPKAERPATVVRVILYSDTLTVEMSDGSLCVSQRPRSGPWQNTAAGCPHSLPVAVSQTTTKRRQLSPNPQGPVKVDAQPCG